MDELTRARGDQLPRAEGGQLATTFSVFADFQHHLYTGADLGEAVEHGRRAYQTGVQTVVLFDDATGERAEIDPRSGFDPWPERIAPPSTLPRSGPGRPKLGVVSREVSLLPRHWAWLNAQPGGASAALRRLVDGARKHHARADEARRARDAAYKFMSAMGGDRPGFEDASRALFADRFALVADLTASWPPGLRDHLRRLLDRAEQAKAADTEAPPTDGAPLG
jgi:hypothetical protein